MTLMYPAPHKAKEFGCEPFDVLEDTKKWYMEHVYGPVSKVNKPAADLHLAKFMSIYAYYDYFRDENWMSQRAICLSLVSNRRQKVTESMQTGHLALSCRSWTNMETSHLRM